MSFIDLHSVSGTGVFESKKELIRLTTERMIDEGVALNLVCLSRPPLHSVPLFKLFIVLS